MHGQMKRDEIEWLYVLFWKCVVRLPPYRWWNPLCPGANGRYVHLFHAAALDPSLEAA